MKKVKLIVLVMLVIISVCFGLFYNSKSKQIDNKNNNSINTTNETIKIQSNEDSIDEEDNLPNEGGETKQIIFIKNLSFLTKDQDYNILMRLKTGLNLELKTIDKSIYEVNLLEETYSKDEDGFKIEAKADKLEGKINIEYKNKDFKFEIIK